VITKGERFSGLNIFHIVDDSGNWRMEKATGSDARKMICNPMTKVLCKFARLCKCIRDTVRVFGAREQNMQPGVNIGSLDTERIGL
jgi:hypothetical protein